MIEAKMVDRMIARGVVLAPPLLIALWLAGGTRWALSGAVGLLMTMGNLWIAGRLIGAVAERAPQLLMSVGMATFALGLLLLTAASLLLRAADLVYFPVTGLTLVGSHLVVVLWEATVAYKKLPGGDSAGSGLRARG